jgi:hypothetical protein
MRHSKPPAAKHGSNGANNQDKNLIGKNSLCRIGRCQPLCYHWEKDTSMQKMRRQVTRLTRDEIARQGHLLYQRRIRRRLSHEKTGRHVAIDVVSADFEVADTALAAAQSLLRRQPDAKVWLERLGYKTSLRIGAWDGTKRFRR